MLEWKRSMSNRYALLIEGARRVGKTHLIQKFIEREYESYREAIKQLVAYGKYHYIEGGSLLGIKENVRDIVIPSEEH